MFDIVINCKICVPKFSDKYWWSKSQHRKYYGLLLWASLGLSVTGALYLLQHHNDRFMSEMLFEPLYWVSFTAFSSALFLLQYLCFFIVHFLYKMEIERFSYLKMLLMKLLFIIAVFHVLLPKGLMQFMVFFATYVQHEDIRTTGYLDHEYHRVCKWMLLYVSCWMFYLFWKDNKRRKRQLRHSQYMKKVLMERIERHELHQYLHRGFMVIVKKDIVVRLSTAGIVDTMSRTNDALNRALQLDFDQISKSVYIAKVEILSVQDGCVQVSANLRTEFDSAVKRHEKFAVLFKDSKSDHGVWTVSPVYIDKLSKR